MTSCRSKPASPARSGRKQIIAAAIATAFVIMTGPAVDAANARSSPRRAETGTERSAASASSARHPAIRTTASPVGGGAVAVNPPPLLWAAGEREKHTFAVQLSRDPSFAAGATTHVRGLRWAMYNAHRQLEPGRWYWRHAIEKPGAADAWSPTHEFTIGPATRVFVTPPAERMLAAIPAGHPRILARAEELDGLRARAATQDGCRALLEKARRLVKVRLPAPEEARPAQKGATAFEARNFAKWASKAFAGNFVEDITALAPAYLLSGDAGIGRAALDRALFLAGLDPDGDTSPKVSDFADGSCMRAMALAYDSCFALLSGDEAERLRGAMAVRANRFFGKHINSLEGRLFSPHIWQHILAEAAEIAFATAGELPEARTWAAFVYELWLNRFPPIGGDDGGWTEGLGYLGTNLETMLLMPQRLGELTGVDFYDLPWYRHAPYFHLYGWPVRSVNAGFGDGDHDSKSIGAARAYFVETLGRRFGNAEAVRYAEAVRGGKSEALPPLFLWHRLREPAPKPVPAAPAMALPRSHAFRDVGLVAMHTGPDDSRRNVFVAFNSCPYGAYGHMHPAQNAFNVMLGGERLFANSGYYIAFGDAHFQGWYHNTRGHNSVLIDGRGQVSSSEGWGWIARHADSGSIAYTLGDASPAYGGTGMTRFRRHMVLLRPATVVLYDELEADHAAQWTWLLHSPAQIKSAGEGVRLRAGIATGEGQVDVYGSGPLKFDLHDRFDPPADNWRGKRRGGEVQQYPNQWHALVEPRSKAGRVRFLAVMQLRPTGDANSLASPRQEADGSLRVGGWTVRAALDPQQKASLVISGPNGQSVLATGVTSVEAGGRSVPLAADETILVEGGAIIRAAEMSGG